MKVSYQWLKEYTSFSLDAEALADALTMSGLEVEEVEQIGSTFDGIVVGRVISAEKHPDADRLSCCTVDVGEESPLKIVCGAPNVAAGQLVPVATVGTVLNLPDRDNSGETVAVKIKKSKIRGQVSQGMICAEDELGLSSDHSGIMVLEDDAVIGGNFLDYLENQGQAYQDRVIDIAITPNRPDAISHIGVARDVAALVDAPLTRPAVPIPEAGGEAASMIDVQIDDPDGCRRYVAMIVKDVTIADSPAWMQNRLKAIGLRPRNNVVDITNYVMYECGQPLHAFDYDQVGGQKIIVRFNRGGEKFTTLDSKVRELPERTVMICDAEREVAIGGIMGGENSEVTDSTATVLIESAYFDPSTIRRTAKSLGLQTDASYRFERGVDSDGQVWAAARAAQLIVELTGGTLVEGMVDAHPAPITPPMITVRHRRVGQIIGLEIDPATIRRFLRAIGFGVEDAETEVPAYLCSVPSFRPDIEREIDVIEEIARLYGYNTLPEPSYTRVPVHTPRVRPAEVLSGKIKSMLKGLGFREVYSNSMLRVETAEAFNVPLLSGVEGEIVHTLKPISQDMAALRPSMLPGILKIMAHNQNHGQQMLRYMELGHVFHKADVSGAVIQGYSEQTSLIVAMGGVEKKHDWMGDVEASGFHVLKGVVEGVLELLGVKKIEMEAVYESTAVTKYHVEIRDRKGLLGIVASLSHAQTEAYDFRDSVFFAELNWDALMMRVGHSNRKKYEKISRFPLVDRDLAVIVDRDQDIGPLLAAVRKSAGELLKEVSVFDVYTGDRVENDKKSVAFGLRFGTGKTLKDREVERSIDAVVQTLNRQFDAELRK